MSKRLVRLYLNDILESADAILSYTNNMSFEDFKNDRKTYSAVIREFEIIGEASKKIPSSITQKYKDIEWREIGDFRNLLIHEYFGVDLEIVWNTIKDLTNLKIQILKIIKELPDESAGTEN